MRRLFATQSITHAFVHIVAILSGYGLSALIAAEDKFSYGAASGWWLSLYIGFVANVRWPAIMPFSILYIAFLLVDIFSNAGWFYTEGASSNPTGYFLLSLIGLPIFVSPILLNEIVRRVQKRFAARF